MFRYLQCDTRKFILESFDSIPNASFNKVALDLGAGITQRDITLTLDKGYELLAYDSKQVSFELQIPNEGQYVGHYKVIDNILWDEIPQLDLVLASFALPFYLNFDYHWPNIIAKIKPGGYFIGNFLDPDTSIFADKYRDKVVFHTKAQVLELFKDFKILKFEKVKYISDKPKGCEHYYEVLAKKR